MSRIPPSSKKTKDTESSKNDLQSIENQSHAYSAPVKSLEELFIIKIPVWKRALDIVGAITGILLSSPIMLIVAIVIKLDQNGPVFFKQQRSGLGGKPFNFYKFRSMVVDAESKKEELMQFNERTGPVFKMATDPRVTRVGRFIRRWSIDEIPQFFNVLKGDMSLVGPRPPLLDEIDEYEKWHKRRLDIKPGLTCIWQAYARDNKCFDQWVRLDINYVQNRSLLLDLKILLKTIPAVISRKGSR